MTRASACTIAMAGLIAACGNSTGSLTILLQPEDTITNGLDPGTAEENIVDGWTVRYTKYLVAIGDVRLEQTTSGTVEEDPSYHVVNLRELPQEGIQFASFDAIDAVRWDQFGYDVRFADGAMRHATASEADFDEMMANGWTFLVEGTLENPSGQSCPPGGSCRPATSLTFRIGAQVNVRFSNCETEDGLPGVTVTPTGTSAAITIHGDHLWFNGFPSGAEIVERRAQWMADCDIDGNGAVTSDELMMVDASALFPAGEYMLAGAPPEIPIDTAWDFARAQLATTGHFQGEGGCPWTIEH